MFQGAFGFLGRATIGAILVVGLAACSSGGSARPVETSAVATTETSAGLAGTIWVADEGGNSLTVVDAATSRVAATVSGISEPHNVQVSPDGTRVYAVSGDAAMVAALDPATYRLTAARGTGAGPAHVVLTPDGTTSFVTNYGDGTVSAYTAGNLTPTAIIGVGGGPHGARPTPDGKTLVVANLKAGTVDLIDVRIGKKTAAIPVGGPPVQVAASPDNRFAYASISKPAEVVKIDLAARAVVARTSVSSAPAQVDITPDGRTLLSADQGTKDNPGSFVSLIDTAQMTSSGRIPTGAGPHGVVVDPTGRRAWVTNMFDGTVSVLDLAARQAVATVKVGDEPNGISFSPRPPAQSAGPVTVTLPHDLAQASGSGMPSDMPGMP